MGVYLLEHPAGRSQTILHQLHPLGGGVNVCAVYCLQYIVTCLWGTSSGDGMCYPNSDTSVTYIGGISSDTNLSCVRVSATSN
jgi:hypothetical protein